MRYSVEHKEQTRKRVLTEAAAAMRAAGPAGVSVAGLMSKLGLTHGGFYAHFKSKDDLVAQAIGQMFDESYAAFKQRSEGVDAKTGLTAFIDMYLSPRHRDAKRTGCPMPSLSGELPRLGPQAQARFGAAAERLSGAFARLLDEMGTKDAAVKADSAVAEMVGAVTISRAMAPSAYADRILVSARESLRSRLGV